MRDFVSIYVRDICDVFAEVRKRSREKERETNTIVYLNLVKEHHQRQRNHKPKRGSGTIQGYSFP